MHPEELATALHIYLADNIVLALKAYNYHWNVTGEGFKGLHTIFQEVYEDAQEVIDIVGERIRALDYKVHATMADFLQVKTLEEGDSEATSEEMILDLESDHNKMSEFAGDLAILATEYKDDATLTIMGERRIIHEKFAWLLKSSLNIKE